MDHFEIQKQFQYQLQHLHQWRSHPYHPFGSPGKIRNPGWWIEMGNPGHFGIPGFLHKFVQAGPTYHKRHQNPSSSSSSSPSTSHVLGILSFARLVQLLSTLLGIVLGLGADLVIVGVLGVRIQRSVLLLTRHTRSRTSSRTSARSTVGTSLASLASLTSLTIRAGVWVTLGLCDSRSASQLVGRSGILARARFVVIAVRVVLFTLTVRLGSRASSKTSSSTSSCTSGSSCARVASVSRGVSLLSLQLSDFWLTFLLALIKLGSVGLSRNVSGS
ncbi:hypothetical protein OGAPHI_004764 [Ogataea philodendri]|uniref:Uncharacterized protein n=1 Tax=Ogataea philodendri TaxID=1378263 RepID=A0A9P8P2G0_9ASCO|nr:uncharacterized protein OGAPHI_004764 [Ogataea philodendri]KAH3664050.1 hypothetical protein OGAPHI_004764 [Ogataea philodendri]